MVRLGVQLQQTTFTSELEYIVEDQLVEIGCASVVVLTPYRPDATVCLESPEMGGYINTEVNILFPFSFLPLL